VKVNVSLGWIFEHFATKADGGVRILDLGTSWKPLLLYPYGTSLRIGCYMSPRTDVDDVERKSCLYQDSNSGPQAIQLFFRVL
jgi:hypothetical protein